MQAHERALLEDRDQAGETVEELEAVRAAEGFAATLIDAFWLARPSTPSDQPVPLLELRAALEELGLGSRLLELLPALRQMDQAFLEAVAARRREEAERRRLERGGR